MGSTEEMAEISGVIGHSAGGREPTAWGPHNTRATQKGPICWPCASARRRTGV